MTVAEKNAGRGSRHEQAKRAYNRAFLAEARDELNDVGTLPKIKNPKLRKRMLDSLEVFLTEAFKDEIFVDPFGPVQRDSIAQEEAILNKSAGRLNKLEPRGFGKTTRSALGAIWACLKKTQDFIILCGDSEAKSRGILDIVLHALSTNQVLLDCFPELMCFHKLAGSPHRGRYQTYKGEKTGISISGSMITGPKVGAFKDRPFIIAAVPYQSTRGLLSETTRRPTCIILDDVQTTEEASSPKSTDRNLKTLFKDIVFLGTRKRPVAIINNATIIAVDDFPHSLTKNRSFVTVRYKMVDSMPSQSAMVLWERYREIRFDYDELIVGDKDRAARDALAFYQTNREAMDDGSRVTWDYAFAPMNYQISTIQAAMDFIYDGGPTGMDSFLSECQNDPVDERAIDSEFLKVSDMAKKVHAQGANEIPLECETIKAAIDVQKELFFFELWGFSTKFDGFCLNYGTFPQQPTRVFQKNVAVATLTKSYPNMGLEARLYHGLMDLIDALCGMTWRRQEDGAQMSVSRIGIDSRYNTSTVRRVYRDSPHRERILLTMGQGYGRNKRPLREKAVKTGERKGPFWFYGSAEKSGVRTLEIDTNRAKTFIQQRFATAINDGGSFSFYKETPEHHRLVAEHHTAEYRDQTDGPYGKVDEWHERPGTPDNDWLDCTGIVAAVASFDGISMVGTERIGTERRSVDLSKWGTKR